MMTFREKTTHLLKRLRRIQMVSLILLLVGFVLPFFGWESNVMLYGKILMLIGFMGEFYCWAKARQIKCPQCGKSLGYLLHDPSYSKTNGVLIAARFARQVLVTRRMDNLLLLRKRLEKNPQITHHKI